MVVWGGEDGVVCVILVVVFRIAINLGVFGGRLGPWIWFLETEAAQAN